MKQFLAILFFGFVLAQSHTNADCVTYCDANLFSVAPASARLA